MNDIQDILARIGELPPQERPIVRSVLRAEVERAMLDHILKDPERYTELSLSRVYAQLARGGESLGRIELREDNAPSSPVKEEIIRRLNLLISIGEDEKAQREAMRKFEDDPKAFFDDWVWMTDPRRPGLKLIPFRLFEKQREIVDFVDAHRRDSQSCMIEKTRDFGVSVIAIGMGVSYWLTIPQSICAYGSRKATLVHKTDDFDSLLEKASIILRNLPTWMLPNKFSFDKHFNYMNIVNPANGAQIKGEAGDELGRGGRAMIFFADEFPKVKNQAASHQSLSGTTDCAVYFGTSGGVNTYFYRMKVSRAYNLLSVPWYWDPRKLDDPKDIGNPQADSTWKRNKMTELLGNEAAFNQEFGCDDSKALESIVIAPEWVDAATKVKLDTGSQVTAGLDLAEEGGDESVLAIRRGGVLEPLSIWTKMPLKELAPKANAHAEAKGVIDLYYDRSGLGSEFEGPLTEQAPRYNFKGLNGQSPADKFVRYEDEPSKPARERFQNKITELWWSLRRRFYKTWEYHTKGIPYPHDELISIPADEKLILQLSARQYFMTGTGKIQLEPKKNMSVSPDRADALAHAEETWFNRQRIQGSGSTESTFETAAKYEW